MGTYIYTRRNNVVKAMSGENIVAFEYAYKEFYWEPTGKEKRALGVKFAAADRAVQKTFDVAYGTLGPIPKSLGDKVPVFEILPRTNCVYDSDVNPIGILIKTGRGEYTFMRNEEVVA